MSNKSARPTVTVKVINPDGSTRDLGPCKIGYTKSDGSKGIKAGGGKPPQGQVAHASPISPSTFQVGGLTRV